MAITVITDLYTRGDVLKYELNQNAQRRVGTVLMTATLQLIGAVMGRTENALTAASVVVAAGAGNTGNGTVTKDVTTPVQAGARNGVYRIELTTVGQATTPAVPAQWTVYGPDGTSIGTVATGATFTEQIKFAIAAGGTAAVLGDYFTFEVVAGTRKLVPISPTQQGDGSHNFYGVLLENVDASDGDVETVVLTRGPAIVARHSLVWGAGFTTEAHKAFAIGQMNSVGIIIGEDK